jgi:hypothetical protein
MEISILGFKFRLELLILIVVIYWIMAGHLVCSCSKFPLMGMLTGQISPREGFVSTLNDGESSSYSLGGKYNGVIMPASTWGQPTLEVVPGQSLNQGVKNILNREKQPIPLPEGELNMFETTPFKPECCPNAYSNSEGCACMTVDQYNYLITRGGNNVPYSEY